MFPDEIRKLIKDGISDAEVTVQSEDNTHYNAIAAATAMILPDAAAGSAGDYITVYYGVAAGNGNAHTYTAHSNDDQFALGSTAVRVGGAVTSKADISVASDNRVTITKNTKTEFHYVILRKLKILITISALYFQPSPPAFIEDHWSEQKDMKMGFQKMDERS